jgi:hypothetical protein
MSQQHLSSLRDRESAPEVGAPEIEVTPAMIAAGEAAIYSFRDDLMASSLVAVVYRAMERAKKCPPLGGTASLNYASS